MRIVVALGGNALAGRGQSLDLPSQRANVARAAAAIAPLARDHEMVITHGNGPQVGLLALQTAAYPDVAPYPLDALDAESAGLIGYLIDQALAPELPGRVIVTLLTQVEVDPRDPAFDHPTKPIGPGYAKADADALARDRGWVFAREGAALRRVVPSPEPRRLLELPAIRLLLDAGAIVVCAGGGGIPVRVARDGTIRGVEAVIDKDLAAALLAREIGAHALLLLTDVPAVQVEGHPLHETTPGALRTYRFAPGTMGPKVEAACRFVEAGGRYAAIGALEDAMAIFAGERGTIVRPA